jgi:hypothetical protein
MENLVIEKTGLSPQVEFYTNGNLKLAGRSLPENIDQLYNPIINFVCNLCVEKVVFDINLEYFNKPSSKKLLELMRNLEANNKIGSILINWYYEEGDDSSLEMAEVYEELLMRTEFFYREFADSIIA